MNLQEEMTKLLMKGYDKGVEDATQEAIIVLEKTIAIVVAAEREACAKVIESHGPFMANGAMLAEAIRARGTT